MTPAGSEEEASQGTGLPQSPNHSEAKISPCKLLPEGTENKWRQHPEGCKSPHEATTTTLPITTRRLRAVTQGPLPNKQRGLCRESRLFELLTGGTEAFSLAIHLSLLLLTHVEVMKATTWTKGCRDMLRYVSESPASSVGLYSI